MLAKLSTQIVILAGGLGTRISEETHLKPKPMVEIGGMPIIWHIMKIYSYYGFKRFVICCGYKGSVIKEFFVNYAMHAQSIRVYTRTNSLTVEHQCAEDWEVLLCDTGLDTGTGGRLLHVDKYIDSQHFMLTYGDGLANINIDDLITSHYTSNCLATVTAVRPPGRFGVLDLDKSLVTSFSEKPSGDGSWISGGFFVIDKSCLSLIDSYASSWEDKPLNTLASTGQLNAYCHTGFWQPMDTLRDKNRLEDLWNNGNAPWKAW